MNSTETFTFTCKRDRTRFEAETATLARSKHLFLALATLGVWYVFFAFYQMIRVYRLSRCPSCGKRSRKLLTVTIVLILTSVELLTTVYHFTVSAPRQIVADASTTGLPEDLDLSGDLDREGFIAVMTYLWITALLPTAGLYINAYAPYLILGWFGFVVLIGMSIPSLYQKRRLE